METGVRPISPLPTLVDAPFLASIGACPVGTAWLVDHFPEGLPATLRSARLVYRKGEREFLDWFLGYIWRKHYTAQDGALILRAITRQLLRAVPEGDYQTLKPLIDKLDGEPFRERLATFDALQRSVGHEDRVVASEMGYTVKQCLEAYAYENSHNQLWVPAQAISWRGRTAHESRVLLESVVLGLGFPRG